MAQSFMTDCVRAAGFGPNDFLTEEGALVRDSDMGVSVATDDVLHYFRGSREDVARLSEVPPSPLERVFKERGIKMNSEKSFDLKTSATCLGVEVVDGTHLGPRGRLAQTMLACVDSQAR